MTSLVDARAAGKKYERRIAPSAQLRKFCGGDPQLTLAVMLWVNRYWHETGSLWCRDGEAWIAQPIRCFADELGLAESFTKKLLARAHDLDLFQVTARKLHPQAVRLTTHIRPTNMLRLFLHRIGWRTDPEAESLEVDLGQRLDTASTQRKVHIASIEARYMASIEAPNGSPTEGDTYMPFGGNPLPPSQEIDQVDGEFKGGKKTVESGFKGKGSQPLKAVRPTTLPAAGPKPPQSVQAAIQGVLAKKPSSKSKGEKQALWKSVADVVHKAGLVFPISAPPAMLARLWKLREDLKAEYPDKVGLLYDVVAATAGDWAAFSWWLTCNSTVKKIPAAFDLLWLQFHRQKAVEYAIGEGQPVGVAVLTGQPVQSIAQEGPGTDLAADGWNIV